MHDALYKVRGKEREKDNRKKRDTLLIRRVEGCLQLLPRRHRRHRPLSLRRLAAGGVGRRIRILYSPYMCACVFVYAHTGMRNLGHVSRKRVPMRSRIHLAHSSSFDIRTDSLSTNPGLEPRSSYFYHRDRDSIPARYETRNCQKRSHALSRQSIAGLIKHYTCSIRRVSALLGRIRHSAFGVAQHLGYVQRSARRIE